jgi:hypothetical protein
MEEQESQRVDAAGSRSVLRREVRTSWREFVVEATTDADGTVSITVQGRDVQGGVTTRLDAVVARGDLHALAQVFGGELRTIGAWSRAPHESYADLVNRVRQAHGKAYAPWTADEERTMLARFRAGASVVDLSQQLGRSPSAVYSRLVQLGEIEAVRVGPA